MSNTGFTLYKCLTRSLIFNIFVNCSDLKIIESFTSIKRLLLNKAKHSTNSPSNVCFLQLKMINLLVCINRT